jgi:hypothetical protein
VHEKKGCNDKMSIEKSDIYGRVEPTLQQIGSKLPLCDDNLHMNWACEAGF